VSWFRVDDGFVDHPKARAAGKDGRTLWFHAGVKCGQHRTNGLVHAHLVGEYGYAAGLGQQATLKAADALVVSGLWHDAASAATCPDPECRRGDLGEGSFLFHQWYERNPLKEELADEVTKAHASRGRALKRDRELIEQIRARDGTLCRYCGIRTRWQGDRRSPVSGTYDHVDPDGGNTLENVVVACRKCNGNKRDRTPEEAGMPLLPPGTSSATRSDLDRNQVATQNGAGSDQVPARETGRVWVGTRSEPGRLGLVPGLGAAVRPGARPDLDRANGAGA